MKICFIVRVSFLLLLFSAISMAQDNGPAGNVVQNIAETNPIRKPALDIYPEIVAEVNGEKITREDLIQESLRTHGEEILQRMLNRALILDECKKRNINITRTEVDREIERLAKQFNIDRAQFLNIIRNDNNMSPDQYANEVIWPRLALETLIYDKIQVSQEDIEKKYLSTYGPSIGLLMIAAQTQEKAAEIRERVLKDPDSFGEIAKTESIDMLTASNKGRMQPVFQFSLPDADLEKQLFALKEGEISPVIGPYGPQKNYMIFQCEKRYDSIVPKEKIDKIKDQLTAKAKADKLKGEAQRLFERLGKEAKVENILKNPELRKQYPNLAATINGQPIYLESVLEMCLNLYARQDLESMISIRMIGQECKKVQLAISEQDLDTDIWIRAAEATLPLPDGSPNIKEYMDAELAKYEVPKDVYRTNIVLPGVALKKLSAGLVKVTDEDIQKGFEANFGPRVQCLGIVLKEERRARDVWQKARTLPAKENKKLETVFEELAAEYSIEPGSKQMRGKIPPIIKNGGQPKLEEEAFQLKPGELSSVIQIDRDTFVILYCQEIIPPKEVKLDQVKDSLMSDIKKKKEMIAINEFYKGVMKRATIINYLTGETFTPAEKTIPINTPDSDDKMKK